MNRLWKSSIFDPAIRILASILIAGYVLCCFPSSSARYLTADDDDALGNATICVNEANVRDRAGTVDTNVIAKLPRDTRVTACEVVELTSDPSGQLFWCKIVFSDMGQSKTGYVVDAFLTKDQGLPSDEAFEKEIAAFPESYKSYLRVLHQAHPAWHFKMIDVGRDFMETVDIESKIGVSLIVNSANDAWKSTEPEAYDWKTDTFIVYDGQTWVNAAKGVVEYYLDPRNMLNEQYVFQFANLAYHAETQPIESVQCVLNGSFMQSGTITNMKGQEVTYAQTFVRAAELSGANPVFLASKCLQEVSPSGSGSTSGNYGSYAGYYNYFNIGAYSSADPVAKGLSFAKNGSSDGNLNNTILIPWTSPYRAICGGSIFIASQYIGVGQSTIYLMRFNVCPSSSSQYGKHQYMTNIQGAAGESKKMFNAYNKAGILDTEITFHIPVYQNMPETPCALPKQNGNPNNCLSSLSVEGYLLTPQFDPTATMEYSLVVPASCTSVNILAQSVSSKATVSGTGAVALGDGVNQITVTVTAQNGNTREYIIHVARDTESPVNYFSVPLVNSGNNYSGFAPDTTVEQLLGMFTMQEGYTLSYCNMNASPKDPASKVATGDMFIVLDSSATPVYTGTMVLRGDGNGDGNISSADLTLITHYILGEGSLSASGILASDGNKDGKVNAADLTAIVRHILQVAPLVQ